MIPSQPASLPSKPTTRHRVLVAGILSLAGIRSVDPTSRGLRRISGIYSHPPRVTWSVDAEPK